MSDSARSLLVRSLTGTAVGIAVLLGTSGCRNSPQPTVVAIDNSGPDPADANMASVSDGSGDDAGSANALYIPSQGSRRLLDSEGRAVDGGGRVLGARVGNASRQGSVSYARATQGVLASPQVETAQVVPASAVYANESQAPVTQDGRYSDGSSVAPERTDPVGGAQATPSEDGNWSDDEQDAYNQITEEAQAPPPPLPVYEQPPAPAPNYLWTPGYWGYAPAGYFWIPGAWVAAPFSGALWTPGYWGAWHHHYGYHPGYWGRHVGFYGGVVYGSGYYGSGYHGGYWRGNDFFYNQAVSHVNVVNIHNIYNRTVVIDHQEINNTVRNNRSFAAVDRVSRVSYNGPGGVQAYPQRSEIAAYRSPRVPPMSAQRQIERAAAENRQQFFHANQGRPVLAAAPRPLAADRVAAPSIVQTALDRKGTDQFAGRGLPGGTERRTQPSGQFGLNRDQAVPTGRGREGSTPTALGPERAAAPSQHQWLGQQSQSMGRPGTPGERGRPVEQGVLARQGDQAQGVRRSQEESRRGLGEQGRSQPLQAEQPVARQPQQVRVAGRQDGTSGSRSVYETRGTDPARQPIGAGNVSQPQAGHTWEGRRAQEQGAVQSQAELPSGQRRSQGASVPMQGQGVEPGPGRQQIGIRAGEQQPLQGEQRGPQEQQGRRTQTFDPQTSAPRGGGVWRTGATPQGRMETPQQQPREQGDGRGRMDFPVQQRAPQQQRLPDQQRAPEQRFPNQQRPDQQRFPYGRMGGEQQQRSVPQPSRPQGQPRQDARPASPEQGGFHGGGRHR